MSHLSDLTALRVVVTGGGKGLGKDIALNFAKLGAAVTISGRNEEELSDTVTELRRYHPGCHYTPADIRDAEACRGLIDSSVQLMGGIDVLVNNAGINIAKASLDVTEADWDQVVDTNLKGTFFCSQRAAVHMAKSGQGRIINIASQMGFVGYINRAAYCSSKGGIVQLTKALAVEWASLNIRVNGVAPTFVETNMTSGMLEDLSFRRDVLDRIPLGKLAAPADVTGAVLFLASDMASFITGHTILVDGGWTAI